MQLYQVLFGYIQLNNKKSMDYLLDNIIDIKMYK